MLVVVESSTVLAAVGVPQHYTVLSVLLDEFQYQRLQYSMVVGKNSRV